LAATDFVQVGVPEDVICEVSVARTKGLSVLESENVTEYVSVLEDDRTTAALGALILTAGAVVSLITTRETELTWPALF